MSLILKMQINDQSENKYIFSTENGEIELIPLSVIENGTYTPEENQAYNRVTVNVPQTVLEHLDITANGTYESSSGHAYDVVTVNVQPILDIISDTIIENGTYVYEPMQGYDGLEQVVVNVSVPVPLFEHLTETITSNGTYNYTPSGTDGFDEVDITVNVQGGGGGSSDVITGTVTVTNTSGTGANECWIPVNIPSGKTIAGILIRSKTSQVYTAPSSWYRAIVHWGMIPQNAYEDKENNKCRIVGYYNSATATSLQPAFTVAGIPIASTLGTGLNDVAAFDSSKGLGLKVKATQGGNAYGFAINTEYEYIIILVDE